MRSIENGYIANSNASIVFVAASLAGGCVAVAYSATLREPEMQL